MAKRRRSAKQRANDKKLGAMARARGRRSTPKRRRRKTIKRVSRRAPMARRRRAAPRRRSSSRSLTSKIPFVNNPTIRKVATGIGLATIGTTVISLVAPSIAANPIVKPALAFLGGGIPGVIGQVVVQGGLGGISNIFGGGNGGATGGGAGNTGFA